jgi:hypothetical protein
VSEQYWIAEDEEDAVDLAMVLKVFLCFVFCGLIDMGGQFGRVES